MRRDLEKLLEDCPVADEIVACASELATNAVQHSRSRRPGGTFTLHVEVSLPYRLGAVRVASQPLNPVKINSGQADR